MSTLLDLFEIGVARNPCHCAVVFDDGETRSQLTYLQLKALTSTLSAVLRVNDFCSPSWVVGVVLKPRLQMPAVLLGIMEAGAAFYSIEESMLVAKERLQHVIHKLKISCFILDSDLQHPFEAILNPDDTHQILQESVTSLGVKVFCLKSLAFIASSHIQASLPLHGVIDTIPITTGSSDESTLTPSASRNTGDTQNVTGAVSLSGTDLAYVITTSGTTGLPKVVKVPHQCIVPNIVDISELYALTAGDLVYQASPLTFDPSVVEVMTTLYSGATLLCTSVAVKMRPKALLDVLTCRNSVTVMQVTPSLLSYLDTSLSLRFTLLSHTSSLRVLSLGGEPFPPAPTLQAWKEEGNQTILFNLYGVTEVSSWATCYRLPANSLQSDPVPLGSALMGTVLQVRNVDMETGAGELWIGGEERVCLIDDEPNVTPGTMRFSGDLVRTGSNSLLGALESSVDAVEMFYMGRVDDVIKRSGKRINLLEIDQVAMKSSQVHKAVCLYEDHRLILFIEPALELDSESVGDLQSSLHSLLTLWLPAYYQPDSITLVPRMPLTKHDKVDKRRLMEVYRIRSGVLRDGSVTRASYSAVYGVMQQMYTRNLASMADVSDRDWTTLTLTQLGGDSLAALRLSEDLQATFSSTTGLELVLDQLMHHTLGSVIQFVHDSLTQNEAVHYYLRQNEASVDSAVPGLDSDLVERNVDGLTMNLKKNEESASDFDLNFVSEVAEGSAAGSKNSLKRNEESVLDVESDSDLEAAEGIAAGSKNGLKRYGESVSRIGPDVSFKSGGSGAVGATAMRSSVSSVLKCDAFEPARNDVTQSDISAIEKRIFDIENGFVVKKRKCQPDIFASNVSIKDSELENQENDGFSGLDSKVSTSSDVVRPLGDTVIKDLCGTSVLYSMQRGSTITYHSSVDRSFVNMPSRTGFVSSMAVESNWSYSTGKCVDASPLVVIQQNGEGVIYIGSHSHRFVALSLRTGSALWEVLLPDRIEGSACLSQCSNYVCFGCYDGCVYTLDRLTGRVFWSYQTSSQVKSSPRSTAQGLLCVGSHDKHLHVLNVKTQSCKEVNLACGSIFASPCIDDNRNRVIVGTLGGRLSSIDPAAGVILWNYNIGKPLFSSAIATNFGYCVGCVNHHVYGFNPDGQRMWSYETTGPVFCTPCRAMLVDVSVGSDSEAPRSSTRYWELIIVGSHDHSLYCLNAADGSLQWKTKLSSPIYSTPFCFSIPHVLGQDLVLPLKDHSESASMHVDGTDGICRESDKPSQAVEIRDSSSFSNRVHLSDTAVSLNAVGELLHDSISSESDDARNFHYTPTKKYKIEQQHFKSSRVNSLTNDVVTDEMHGRGCDYVVVCCTSGKLYVLSVKTGAVLTRYQFPGELFSSPVVVGDQIVVGCRDNNVYCVNLTVKGD